LGFAAVQQLFHKRGGTAPVKRRPFNELRVVPEGTEASFSTVLAFGVLEIFGSPLALS
jgi:hypothetical protein